MGSFEKINYSLRPAKAVERKMLCECFRRLSPFGRVDTYRYVGFGSTYFSDFSLIHRSLGIRDLVSIEREMDWIDRFEFNRPYGCIDVKFGESTELLPELDWTPRTILWLDYDGKLTADGLADVATFCRSCSPGSVLVVSVNVHPDAVPQGDDRTESDEEYRMRLLKERLGQHKLPADTDPKRLAGWDVGRLSRRVIEQEVQVTLLDRNGARAENTELRYRQLFNFHYRDGARMMTTGGVVYEVGQESIVNSCGFEQLDFVRGKEEPCEILVPSLTFREMRDIDAHLPATADDVTTPVGRDDLEAYQAIYRYFPTFVEAEL